MPSTYSPLAPKQAIIPLSGVKNFRDLGGLPTESGLWTRWGRLFRSGHLSDMTDGCGMEMLARDVETVIDFRGDAEKERHPVHWTSMWAPDYVSVPIGGNAAAWVREMFASVAETDFPAEELHSRFIDAFKTIPIKNADGLKVFFKTLVEHDRGVILFHCTAGKDRTGIAAALLGRILGVTTEASKAHFMQTNLAVNMASSCQQMADFLSAKAGKAIKAQDVIPLIGVQESFLEATWQAIDAAYGDFETYAHDALGVDGAVTKELRDRYTGPMDGSDHMPLDAA